MLDSETRRRIDTARDILVGKVPDPKSQVEQITIALIYKFMDDMDAESEELGGTRTFFTGEFEKYGWSKLMSPAVGGYDLINLYSDAIQKMDTNPGIPQLFRDMFKNAYLPYRDPETLKSFLKIINDFEYDHSERLGDAFEYLLSILGSQGDAGQFRTPRHIIDFMVEVIDPKKDDVIIDPACGTAGFLISAYKHIIRYNSSNFKPDEYKIEFGGTNGRFKGDKLSTDERKKLADNIKGYDISPDMVRLSLVNMYLHGFPEPHIYEYDTLTSEERWNEYADVIMANPPFMSPKGGIKPHKRFSIQANRSEVLFVDYIAEHLKPNGRAAVIVPEGIVFQTANAYKTLRKYLVDDGILFAVISLPAGVFNPYSGVKTSILLFDKTVAKQRDEILFVKINNDGYSLGAQRKEIEGSDIPEVVNIIKDYKEGKDVPDNALTTTATKKDIAKQDYILVGDRYREAEVSNADYSTVGLGEVCEILAGNSAPQDKELFTNGIYPFFRTADVGMVHLSDNLVSSKDYLNDAGISGLKLFPKGTILFPKSGASTFLNHRAILGVDGYVSSHLACIICDANKINNKYLYHALTNIDARTLTADQAYPSLNLKQISGIKIPLPPLPVQQEIVAEIESYQKIIDGAKQVVDNYKPVIKVDPDWEIVKLGDICELNPKKSELRDLSSTTEVSFVPMANVNEHEMFFLPKETKQLSEVYSGYTYFRNNDVLLAKVTPCFENGKAGIAKNLNNGVGFGSSEFYVLRAFSETVLPDMIYYTINSSDFLLKGKDNMTGTGGLQRLTKDFVMNYLLRLPCLDIQQKIVAQIEKEQELVNSNKQLTEIYEQKIKDKIAEVWGE
ncbi:MAG: N-6 DNA methylase [Dehalococcoidales bacterium]